MCYGCKSSGCNWWGVSFTCSTSPKIVQKDEPWTLGVVASEHGPFCHREMSIKPRLYTGQYSPLYKLPLSPRKRNIKAYLPSHNWDTRSVLLSSFYAAVAELNCKIREYTAQEYSKLAQYYLCHCIQLNPTATAAYQDDDDESFYHLFVSVPNGAKLHRECLQPIFLIDGGFPKTNEFDGVYFLFSWQKWHRCQHLSHFFRPSGRNLQPHGVVFEDAYQSRVQYNCLPNIY
jgi:hypothetical protein